MDSCLFLFGKSDALARAQRIPSVDNLGLPGMVYHSSANYGQVAECYILAIKRDDSEKGRVVLLVQIGSPQRIGC